MKLSRHTQKFANLILTCSALLLLSCNKSETTTEQKTSSSQHTGLESILLTKAPEAEAKSIAVIRAGEVVPGQEITMKAKVIGSDSPFVAGRAIVLLGDPDKLTSCDTKESDTCATPWDVCCDDHDDIKNFTATVQVLNANGKLLKSGLKGLGGIKELSYVIVTGTIAEGSNKDNLLINATGLFVQTK